MKVYLLFAFILAAAICSAKPTKVIFDTDMGNDVDDVLALAMLYSFQNSGEGDLKAVLINKDNPYAPVYTDIVAKYYGFDTIPMGMVENGSTKKADLFIEKISKEKNVAGSYKYARNIGTDTILPSAVKLARKTMAESEDGGLVYISVGFSTNLAAILRSEPDEFSPLNGLELFRKKIKYVSVMAGNFSQKALENPLSVKSEFNVFHDKPSAKYVFEACPVPMVFTGWEIGPLIMFPHKTVMEKFSKENPLVDAFDLYTKGKDRPSWDLISVLYVFRPDMFELSENGFIKSSESGHTSFMADGNGTRRFIKSPDAATAEKIKNELIKISTYRK